MFSNLFTAIFLFFISLAVLAAPASLSGLPAGLHYECRQSEKHRIHILEIDPEKYQLRLVKAHGSVFGRETVPVTAQRTGAIAAINAGFFEIGQGEDGRPSGTLVIKGAIFSLSKRNQDLLLLQDKNLQIANGKIKVLLGAEGKTIEPDTVNRFVAHDRELILYNYLWAPSTLTPYERREVLIDQNGMVLDVVDHGDNAIPPSGWVLSLPPKKSFAFLKAGKRLKIEVQLYSAKNKQTNVLDPNMSIVAGIPALLEDAKPSPSLARFAKNSTFAQAHARSAIGITQSGKIVLVLAEHRYLQDLDKITLKEVKNVLQGENLSKEEYSTLTLPKVIFTLQNKFSKQPNVEGLTLLELAHLMQDLKCIQAINMDGGGSSSLFLNGQVVNAAFGDQDEGLGQFIMRPVSNTLVVIKRE